MSAPVAIFGYGPVGMAVTARLVAEGQSVRVLQRTRPTALPAGVTFSACDVLDAEQVVASLRGVEVAVCALGFPYVSQTWERAWPRAMKSLLAGCEVQGARLVFADNLYMYGPQSAALVETMPLSEYGRKPRARTIATRLWQTAHKEGRVRVTAVRAADFYGPGVTQSVLGEYTLGAIASGRPARLLASPDHPHDIVHVNDFARAIVTLLDAPDDAFGQAWHVPCDRTRTMREVLALGAAALGAPLRIRVVPPPLMALASVLVPTLRETNEMRFLFDRPYRVDWSKFAARFWNDPTPLAGGIAEAARAFSPA